MSMARRYCILGLVALSLSACAARDGMLVESGSDPKTGRSYEIRYSPYFELEQHSDDGVVLARLVVTLGGERVPKDYKFPESRDAAADRRDGLVEWVTEIYFINTSKQPITLTPKVVSAEGRRSFDQHLDIPPRELRITPALVGIGSNYATAAEVSFDYEYAGKTYHVEGKAPRMTVEQVKAKYGSR